MRDVIAIGDVHGDGDRLVHALQRLKLATADAVWTGGTVSLVVMGDVLDGRERGDGAFRSSVGDVDAVRFLAALRASAAARGGRVTCLLGNHELMNRAGVFDYVHRDDFARYGDDAARHARMKAGGDVGAILRTWKRAHIENETLFCHAGVHTDAAGAVRGAQDVTAGLPGVSDWHVLEHRQYMTDSSTAERARLRAMLARCGCRQMVIGHNSVPEIAPTWQGAVVLADACLSRAYGRSSELQVLCVRPDGDWHPVHITLHGRP